ncbi:Rpn family recombination-promoting nuclease/putative transposase [Candidatus Electrothrix sp.]|uniref:Rpn family recombination-promoting nuclease/putative transposase n=1 Tax=Candidatus Electrothrix sp. TaxID=2170559 RepID=UPI004056A042
MSSVTNPHDHVFRQTFGQPEVAAGYFRHNLPEELLEHQFWKILFTEAISCNLF